MPLNTNEGSPIVGVVSVGAYASVEEACGQMVRKVDTVQPSPAAADTSDCIQPSRAYTQR